MMQSDNKKKKLQLYNKYEKHFFYLKKTFNE